MDIRARVDALLTRLPRAPQYPTQGASAFVDLERQEVRTAYTPLEVVKTFLAGRGGNMFYLWNLLDERRMPLDPEVPLIFGSGVLTGMVPSAARGNCTSWSPDSYVLMDCNCGDYFPSFLKLHGYDHLVLYGRAPEWALLRIERERVSFLPAAPYLGMDNLDLRPAIERDFGLREAKDMALAAITRAGENGVLCSGIMGGPKALFARGGPGAKMGALRLKAILLAGRGEDPTPAAARPAEVKPMNAVIAKKLLGTSVVRNALKTTGTPFLYKPSRVLGAMGTKNNQLTSWVDTLDADNIDPYRPGMEGCFRCPVNCRPLNDMTPGRPGGWGAEALKGLSGNASYDPEQASESHGRLEKRWRGKRGDGVFDRWDKGDGPEYVTLGKFGPNLGIAEIEHVLRLNNICNDLGLDTASTGSAIGWAMELYERGIIDRNTTGGMDLRWGNAEAVEDLLFLTSRREGFGDVIADSARAVHTGKYPAEALRYRMTSKGLFQSDPHDARILKAFALGLAVATRGFDHLRNRVTLEINAKINDDAEFKKALYGGVVSPEPQSYDGKEIGVRRCENTFAVGDSVGMCRFTTKLFNSPGLPGYPEFAAQIERCTGWTVSEAELDEIGRNVTGLERLVNFRLGVRAQDDTLPRRWFEEGATHGRFRGEKIDRDEFLALRSRFYALTGLGEDGIPLPDWRARLVATASGAAVRVRLPRELRAALGPPVRQGSPESKEARIPAGDVPSGNGLAAPPGAAGPDGVLVAGDADLLVHGPCATVGELYVRLRAAFPGLAAAGLDDPLYNVVKNAEILLSGASAAPLAPGDQVELVPTVAGG